MNNFIGSPRVMIAAFCIASCTSKVNHENKTNDSTSVSKDSITYDTVLSDGNFKGDAMGDFNGDGITERALVRAIREGEIQSKSWIYIVEFDDSGIPPFSFESETEGYELINEGNLNNFAGDELSVRTVSNSMNHAFLQPYSLYNGVWGQAMETISGQNVVYPQNLPAELSSLSAEQLVFKEGNTVYYYSYSEPEEPMSGDEVFYRKTKASLFTCITPLEHIYNEDTDIKGDFDGNGSSETAWLKILDEAASSDETGGQILKSCVIEFSDKKIKSLSFSTVGEGIDFVSEGNLNKIPGDEISISTGISNKYDGLRTYSYKYDGWQEVMNTIIPRGWSADLDLHLSDIIFKENGEVYYYEAGSIEAYDDTREKSSLKKVKADIIWDF